MSGVKKAELIDSTVFMASPVSTLHSRPDGLVGLILGTYSVSHPQTVFHPNTTVLLGPDDVIQPDGLLRLLPDHGGAAKETGEHYLAGAVEFVAEIAASSVSIDAGPKKESCRRAGVKEYFVWLVDDQEMILWALDEDNYVRVEPDADGVLKSRVFPGLCFDTEALIKNDAAKALSALD